MGGGKSYVGLATLILLCRIYANSKWIVIRESLPTLKRTSLETFRKVLPTTFLKSFNQQDFIAHFKNGSQIAFMAEDWANDKDFDRFKGLEVNGFLLEQIEELNAGLLDVCFIRAGRHKIPGPNQPHPIVMANVNPTQTWPKQKIYEPFMKGTLPEDWFYLPATIFDNPVLANDPVYMANLKNLEEITYKRLIDGDWDAFMVSNPFAYSFLEGKHVGVAKYTPEAEVLLSFDFNIDPITCLAAQHIDGEMRLIKAFKVPNGNPYHLCDAIKAYFGLENPIYLITGDATGWNRSALTIGNLNHYRIIKEQLGLIDTQIRAKKKNMAPRGLRVLLNSVLQHYPVTMDAEGCEGLIFDMKYVEVDEFGDMMKDRTTESRKADLMDCCLYLFETFLPQFLKSPVELSNFGE